MLLIKKEWSDLRIPGRKNRVKKNKKKITSHKANKKRKNSSLRRARDRKKNFHRKKRRQKKSKNKKKNKKKRNKNRNKNKITSKPETKPQSTPEPKSILSDICGSDCKTTPRLFEEPTNDQPVIVRDDSGDNYQPGVIPLPAGGPLLIGGLAALAFLRRRRKA